MEVKSLTAATNALSCASDGVSLNQVLRPAVDRMGCQCMNAAGLTIGSGSKKKIKIANTVDYLINGVMYQKTTAEVDFTATTHDMPISSFSVYCLYINGAGTVTVVKGSTASTAAAVIFPAPLEGQALLGYVRLATSAGAIFDATSDDLDAAHITDTYVDTVGPSMVGLSI